MAIQIMRALCQCLAFAKRLISCLEDRAKQILSYTSLILHQQILGFDSAFPRDVRRISRRTHQLPPSSSNAQLRSRWTPSIRADFTFIEIREDIFTLGFAPAPDEEFWNGLFTTVYIFLSVALFLRMLSAMDGSVVGLSLGGELCLSGV